MKTYTHQTTSEKLDNYLKENNLEKKRIYKKKKLCYKLHFLVFIPFFYKLSKIAGGRLQEDVIFYDDRRIKSLIKFIEQNNKNKSI